MSTQSEIEKVSEALRDELTLGSFSQGFEPGETFDATIELEELDALRVDVVPVGSDPDWESRGWIQWDNVLDVAIRKRLGIDDQDDATGKIRNRHMHDLLLLEQEILVYLFSKAQTLQGYPGAEMHMKPEIRVHWDPDGMRMNSQFTSVIRLTYKTSMEIP
ncbi:hypothetical protein LCGC14_1276340 [marine sediment metagenome]|uniref:Uncharacterized protein n=1 Tax=marine sediment metagenome TaxID=412755 RepID=A0A0F9LHR2_9ZZZZ